MSSAPPPYPGDGSSSYPPNGKSQPAYPPPSGPSPASGAYGPPPDMYRPQPGPGGSHTVVMTQPAVVFTQVFREESVCVQCPHCQADVLTATHFDTGTLSWLVCVIIFLLGCNLGCCLIPFCVDDCKDVVHTCPNCHGFIGRYNRI